MRILRKITAEKSYHMYAGQRWSVHDYKILC